MSAIRELVFDWLINASVQIGLFAILAAVLTPFIAKAKAKYQHCFYLANSVLSTICIGDNFHQCDSWESILQDEWPALP